MSIYTPPEHAGIVIGEERGYSDWYHVISWVDGHMPKGTKFFTEEQLRNEVDRVQLEKSKEAEINQVNGTVTRADGMPVSKTERQLRRMLCLQRHSHGAYMDDGEASWCGDEYCRAIDYMRETPEAIEQAWIEAGRKRWAKPQVVLDVEPPVVNESAEKKINPEDFVISVYTVATGGFGLPRYGVNVSHVPSQYSVSSDTERSQHRNRAVAFEQLIQFLKSKGYSD